MLSLPVPEVSYIQEAEEPKQVNDVSFKEWVNAIRKVWDCYSQEERNLINATDLELDISIEIKRKSKIPLYNNCSISNSELK
ncbi:43006_t:CDS:2, partial [Gigaspora margarita]